MRPDAQRTSSVRGDFAIDDAIRDAAAHWVVRGDRGLSEEEAGAFAAWQQADPRHVVALAEARDDWQRLDRFPAEAAIPARKSGGRGRWWVAAAAGLAAGLAAFFVWPRVVAHRPESIPPVHTFAAVDGVRHATLPDGSRTWINAGGVVLERFGPGQRTVRLLRGEAHFAVAKNPARPFVVLAGAVQIRALGTAFNVHLQEGAVDVVVTEGRVRVATVRPAREEAPAVSRRAPAPTAADTELAILDAGQHALIAISPRASTPPPEAVVRDLDQAEMARTLAWQETLMPLRGATLAEVAKEFERRTGHRLLLAEPELAGLRIGGFFKPDDVEGFVHLLESTFGIQVERRSAAETVLRRRPLANRRP